MIEIVDGHDESASNFVQKAVEYTIVHGGLDYAEFLGKPSNVYVGTMLSKSSS